MRSDTKIPQLSDEDTRTVAQHMAATLTAEMARMTGAPFAYAPAGFTDGLDTHLHAWLNNVRMRDDAMQQFFLAAMAEGCKRYEEHGSYKRWQCELCEENHE